MGIRVANLLETMQARREKKIFQVLKEKPTNLGLYIQCNYPSKMKERTQQDGGIR